MAKYYTGIGSRQTPFQILASMTWVAKRLRTGYDFILRSGGAAGADSAFELGAADKKEIYTAHSDIPDWAMKSVEQFHPRPDLLNNYVKRLHARNALLIFGEQGPEGPRENWSRFIICWTPGGRITGGTGQGLRIAQHYDIPVFNMADPKILARLESQWRQP